MSVVHHDEVRRRLKPRYDADDIGELTEFLRSCGTFALRPLATGLFPAAGLDEHAAARTGYGDAWTRDNVHVAFALDTLGEHQAATRVALRLAEFYRRYRARFTAIADGAADPTIAANRPPIRFDGTLMAELPTRRAQAQNDAIGYFLWLYCRLARAGRLVADRDLLALFPRFFAAIRYWQDDDSGHWEERPKVEASSIGTVVAGLQALRALVAEDRNPGPAFAPELLDWLIDEGRRALAAILPAECIQPDPRKQRRYDAALLFLVYPLEVVDSAMAQRIVDDVTENLQGEYGIRRYPGDSYWTADYKRRVAPAARAAALGERQNVRDALHTPGEEAQWCIFDPIVSVIAGRRYRETGNPADLERQVCHLNRALGQLTGPDRTHGPLRCPEAYYLEEGNYIPNDHVPLLWSQTNLRLALQEMRQSVRYGYGR